MQPVLDLELQRLALFCALGSPGVREIVQTFGFDARSTEAAQIIIRNLRKYIVRIRTTAKLNGRASDSGRQAAATVFAGIVSSPGKKSAVPDGQLL